MIQEDYLSTYAELINTEAIQLQRSIAQKHITSKGNRQLQQALQELPEINSTDNDFSSDIVRLGGDHELRDSQRQELREQLKTFIPWRKGPFRIHGIDIDAEWQSQIKWNRVLPALPKNLNNSKICDIGANSGYYMYRMLDLNPEFVLGLDPTVKYWYQFQALQKLTAANCLQYEAMGLEQLIHFPKFFDLTFCMGILYHHRNPLEILKIMHDSLAPGGTLIIENMCIPGTAPVALFPETSYAGVKGNYFIPTATCLSNWLQKCHFTNIDIFCTHDMNSEQQRQTEWMPFRSYTDMVHEKKSLTIEGYPAPIRVYLKAQRK